MTMALDPAKVQHFLIEQTKRNEAEREREEADSIKTPAHQLNAVHYCHSLPTMHQLLVYCKRHDTQFFYFSPHRAARILKKTRSHMDSMRQYHNSQPMTSAGMR